MQAVTLSLLEGACRLFGWRATAQALSNRAIASAYALQHSRAVAQAARHLQAMLDISEEAAIAYCQQLTPEMRDCLICYLVRDVVEEIQLF
jgi:hypothetical protein